MYILPYPEYDAIPGLPPVPYYNSHAGRPQAQPAFPDILPLHRLLPLLLQLFLHLLRHPLPELQLLIDKRPGGWYNKHADFSEIFILRECWNWQTGTFEVRVLMAYGFKSRLAHQIHIIRICFR